MQRLVCPGVAERFGWHLLGRFRCSKCGGVRRQGQTALRSPLRRHLWVCQACVAGWRRRGQRCGRCWRPVVAPDEIGLLVDWGVFAHLDCGAARLVA